MLKNDNGHTRTHFNLFKSLGINLSKEMKELCNESFKHLKRESHEDTRGRIYLFGLCTGIINMKGTALPKAIHRLSVISIKISLPFFLELERHLKIHLD